MQLTVTRGTKVVQNLQVLPSMDSSAIDNVHYFIGRSPECHIVIDDHYISRNHAQLSFIDHEWNIKRVTGYGEVLLNGVPIQEAPIKDGDIIQISHYCIGVTLEKEELERPVLSDKEVEPVDEKVSSMDKTSSRNQKTETLQDDLQSVETNAEEETNSVNGPNEFNQEEAPSSEESSIPPEEDQGQDEEFGFNQEEDSAGPSMEDNFDEINEQESGALESSFDGVDSDQDTKIVESFIEFELDISGEYTNFDKYYIKKEEVFIGRDPNKCQIVLDDPEASQVHAVIRRKGSHCELEDLDSTNGIILNGSRVNGASLSHKDEFLIGGTSFQFIVKSEFISGEKSRLMPVEKVEEVEVEEVVEEEVDVLADEGSGELSLGATDTQHLNDSQSKSLFSKEALRNPEKRKKILIYALVAMALWVFLDEGTTEKKQVASKEPSKKNRKLVKDSKKNENIKQSANTKRDYQNLSTDLKEYVRTNYELAKTEILEYGNFEQGLQYLDKINEYVDEFEQSKSLAITAKEELKKLEEVEREKKRKQEEEERKIRIGNFLKKANEAFDKEQAELVQSLLDKIAEIDPENLEASQLKLQLDVFIKEEERKAIEDAQRKAHRERLINQLKPGKTLYLKERWYHAIIKLEEFLAIKDNADDLVSEATKMLKESQNNLKGQIIPLLKKAQSLNEGQDQKSAYRVYKEILRIDPSNTNAVLEMSKIRENIERQAKRIYREAIIDESLNYLKKAKEKFQEVQQITPPDSLYYKRAANKLKDYTD